VRSQGNYVVLINIYRARLKHWNKEVKTEKPEQLSPFHLLLHAKLEEQGDKGATCFCFPFEMLTCCKDP
jgi:hypothetical protein